MVLTLSRAPCLATYLGHGGGKYAPPSKSALERHPGTIHMFIGQFFKQNPNFDVSEALKLISRVQEHLLIENPWILSNKIEKT